MSRVKSIEKAKFWFEIFDFTKKIFGESNLSRKIKIKSVKNKLDTKIY